MIEPIFPAYQLFPALMKCSLIFMAVAYSYWVGVKAKRSAVKIEASHQEQVSKTKQLVWAFKSRITG